MSAYGCLHLVFTSLIVQIAGDTSCAGSCQTDAAVMRSKESCMLQVRGVRKVTRAPRPPPGTSRRSFRHGIELIEGPVHFRGRGGTCLNFLHIPKTAGGSIAADGFAVARHGPEHTDWGMYDKDLACSFTELNFTGTWWGTTCEIGQKHGPRCSVFHIPPALDPALAEHYAQCDTFCVVRNPIDRTFSEFKWAHHVDAPEVRNMACDAESYQAWVSQSLEAARSDPYRNDCHFLPQSLYVFGSGDADQFRPRDRLPTCNRILKFESLSSDFDALMQEYDIPLRLQAHKHAVSDCEIPSPAKAVPALYDFYAEDFDAFGYQ